MGLEHGRRRRQSDECGSAKHGRHARYGLTSARTAAAKASAVVELSSREATQRVQGVRRRQRCCEHGWSRSQWKEGGGSGICEYGRRRNGCRECGGSASICEHVRHRMVCKEHAAAAGLSKDATRGCALSSAICLVASYFYYLIWQVRRQGWTGGPFGLGMLRPQTLADREDAARAAREEGGDGATARQRLFVQEAAVDGCRRTLPIRTASLVAFLMA